MATRRLKVDDRRSIIQACLNDTFKAREEELTKLITHLSGLVYKRAMPEGFTGTPASWYKTATLITVFDETWAMVSLPLDSKPAPYCSLSGYHKIIINVQRDKLDHAEKRMVDSVIKEKDQLSKDREILDKKLQSVVAVSTLKQLEDAWPEGKKFYAFLYNTDNLPAVSSHDLDQTIAQMKKGG